MGTPITPEHVRERIRGMYERGAFDVEAIARTCGVSKTTVYEHVNDLARRRAPRTRSRTGTYLSEDMRERVRALYKRGTPLKDIVKRCNVSRTTIARITRELSLTRRPTGRRSSPEAIALARRLFTAGLPVRAIMQHCNMSFTTVFRHTRDLPRRINAPSSEAVALVRRLYLEGLSWAALETETGLTYAMIARHTRDLPRRNTRASAG